jgi:HK97 family phage major capsid protein
MAITAATTTSGFSGFLNADQSGPIFEQAMRTSVVQQLGRRVPLGANGVEIPVVSTKPTAGWVAEAGVKPATQGTMALKTMTPKKLAAIAVVSAEVVRANPGGYVDLLRPQLAEAFAIAFDSAALHGTNTPFTTYIDQTTQTDIEIGTAAAAAGSVYADINSGLAALVADGKRLTGFAFDVTAEPLFNAAVDTTGRPLFVDSPTVETAASVQAGRILGRPAFIGEGVSDGASIVGYGGDWSQVAWGTVGGINYDVSTETSVTINGALVSLWERNLLAVRAEAEYGFLVNDVDAFVTYINAA